MPKPKSAAAKRPNLRKLARGMPCQIRIPGVCTGGGEDTVLAHYRLAGTCGTGIKPPDLLGAHSCAACHDLVDGRTTFKGGMVSTNNLRLWHAEGVMRTLYQLTKDGVL